MTQNRRFREGYMRPAPPLPVIEGLHGGGYMEVANFLGELALAMAVAHQPPEKSKMVAAYDTYRQMEDTTAQPLAEVIIDVLANNNLVIVDDQDKILFTESGKLVGAYFLNEIIENAGGKMPPDLLH